MVLSLSDSLKHFNRTSNKFIQFNEFNNIDFEKEEATDYKKLSNTFLSITNYLNKDNKINIASLKHYLTNFGDKLPINRCDSFFRPIDSHLDCTFDDLVYLLNYKF